LTDLPRVPQVKFAYNATRALGTKHTPFEANLNFPLRSFLICCSSCNLRFPFRKKLRSGYNCYMSYMLWYDRCYKCRRMRCMLVQNSPHPRTSRSRLVNTVTSYSHQQYCLHPVFHISSLRPYSTTSPRLVVPVTTLEGDDDEFDVPHIVVACI
jgi:hypothetical protein